MTERIMETPEALLSEREVLEQMTPDQLVDLILKHGETVGNIERIMNLASSVLDGYGVTVESALEERQNGNKQK